jgi:outer membrane protein assembly factor BamB
MNMGFGLRARAPHVLGTLGAAILAISTLTIAPALAHPPVSFRGCAGDAPGGEWRSAGNGLANMRSQPESSVDAADAANLEVAWAQDLREVLGLTPSDLVAEIPSQEGVTVHSTPVVAAGCVFVVTNGGRAAAFNADDGTVAWATEDRIASGGTGANATNALVGTPTYDDGTLYLLGTDPDGAHVWALDARNGHELWTKRVDSYVGADGRASFSNSSPVLYDDVLFAGFSAPEGDANGRGGFALLDKRSGEILAKTYTVDPADHDHAGGGIWSTPAVDQNTGYAYVGTGNPGTSKPHPNTDAILKIDVNRHRRTFGQIVASYQGTPDNYAGEPLYDQAACETEGENRALWWPNLAFDGSIPCGQIDMDFGASPNLIAGPGGRTLVVELQKSGVLHAVDAATMTAAWTATLSAPDWNAGTTATDGTHVYGQTGPSNLAFSVDAADGRLSWATPSVDPVHFLSTTYANGLVFVPDSGAMLHIYDAATGAPVATRSMAVDVGRMGAYVLGSQSAGVAVARNMVYAAPFTTDARLLNPTTMVMAYRPKAARIAVVHADGVYAANLSHA